MTKVLRTPAAMSWRRWISALLVVLLPSAAAVRPAGGAPQTGREPTHRIGERYAIGADLSRYAALYGTPEFRGIDDEMARPWPRLQNIRTVAVLAGMPGQTDDPGAAAYPGRVVEYSSSYATHLLCGDRYCVGVRPVEEMREFFMGQGRSWFHQKVEVIGAIDMVGDPRDDRGPTYAFRVWSVQLFVESEGRRRRDGPTLESLVMDPKAAAGRSVTVRGTFRGANLFEDLPPETRRHPSDWVMKDGPFSIWVTDRAPKGNGFSLDPSSRSDCDWRVEVNGKVQTAAGYVYLRARSVVLVKREEQ
jgi:hypothetical protein